MKFLAHALILAATLANSGLMAQGYYYNNNDYPYSPGAIDPLSQPGSIDPYPGQPGNRNPNQGTFYEQRQTDQHQQEQQLYYQERMNLKQQQLQMQQQELQLQQQKQQLQKSQ